LITQSEVNNNNNSLHDDGGDFVRHFHTVPTITHLSKS